MANPEQLVVLRKGATHWNNWRRQNRYVACDLSRANLFRTDLSGADLSEADLFRANLNGADLYKADLYLSNLSEADLSGANLRKADLNRADLSGTHLNRADLNGTNLRETNLRGADLNRADLSEAYLSGTDLNGADLSRAIVGLTDFADIDLRTVKGLETINHKAPSSIGIDTLFRSQGQIPESFLRKAGVPEDILSYLPSLMNHAIEYYTCFVSYASQNEDFAQRLYVDLQANGVRCWLPPEDMKIGDKIRQRIDETIRLYDKLLIILSEQSVTSAWVEYEVEAALAKERRENRTVLFPIRLDSAVMSSTTAWAAHIKDTRHIGNFSQWKDHDSYQHALHRLLRDLQPERPQNT